MKKRLITTALLAALSITTIGAAAAQNPAAGTQATKPDGERHRGHGMRGHGGDRVAAIARFDIDKDGRISRAEAQAAQQAMQARRDAHRAERTARGDAPRAEPPAAARGERPQRGPGARSHKGDGFDLVANFDAIDTNRDGYLTRSELRTWHIAKAAERRAEGERRFDAKFRETDLNNDGKLSRVEVAEKMPRLAGRFDWLDDNRDGFLSREELRPARPQR
ncbi:EF-hand domain-containing protein [Luteimonas sp. TWI165]|uniref:EF-hand domain-containing protein n=1 Tax=Luteimonas sp. TWI165 TaxID=3136772 RepID=UPI0032092C7B